MSTPASAADSSKRENNKAVEEIPKEFAAPPIFSNKQKHWFDGTAYAVVQQKSASGNSASEDGSGGAGRSGGNNKTAGLSVVVPLLKQQQQQEEVQEAGAKPRCEEKHDKEAEYDKNVGELIEQMQQNEQLAELVVDASTAFLPASLESANMITIGANHRGWKTTLDSRHGASLVCPAFPLTKMELLPRSALRLHNLAILDLSNCHLIDLGSGAAWRFIAGTLRVLYLHDNKIARYSYLESVLSELFKLQHLTIAGNYIRPPNPQHQSIRQFLAQTFLNLLVIDEHFVLDVERIDYVAPPRKLTAQQQHDLLYQRRCSSVVYRDLYVPFSPHTHIGCERTSYQLRHSSIDIQRQMAIDKAAERAAKVAANGGVLLPPAAVAVSSTSRPNSAINNNNSNTTSIAGITATSGSAYHDVAPSSAVTATTTMEALVEWEWRHLRYLPLRAITLSPAALIQKCWRRYWSRKRFVAARAAVLRKAREKFHSEHTSEQVSRALEVLRRVVAAYARARRGAKRMIERRISVPGRRCIVFVDQLEMHRWERWLKHTGGKAVMNTTRVGVKNEFDDSGELAAVIQTPNGPQRVQPWFSMWPSWHTPDNDRRELITMNLCRSIVFASYTARKFLFQRPDELRRQQELMLRAAAMRRNAAAKKNRGKQQQQHQQAEDDANDEDAFFCSAHDHVDPGKMRTPKQRRYVESVQRAFPNFATTKEELTWMRMAHGTPGLPVAATAASVLAGQQRKHHLASADAAGKGADIFQGLVLSKSRRHSLAHMMNNTFTSDRRRASINVNRDDDDENENRDGGERADAKKPVADQEQQPEQQQQQQPSDADGETAAEQQQEHEKDEGEQRRLDEKRKLIEEEMRKLEKEREEAEDARTVRLMMQELVRVTMLKQRARPFNPFPLRAIYFESPAKTATFLLRLMCFNRQRPRSQIHFFFEDDLARLRAATVVQAWWRGMWVRLRLVSWQYRSGGRRAVWNYAVARRLHVGPRLLHFSCIQIQNWFRTRLALRRHKFLSTLRKLMRGHTQTQSASLYVSSATLNALLADLHHPIHTLFVSSPSASVSSPVSVKRRRSSTLGSLPLSGSISGAAGTFSNSGSATFMPRMRSSSAVVSAHSRARSSSPSALRERSDASVPSSSSVRSGGGGVGGNREAVLRRRTESATCMSLEQNLIALAKKLESCRLSHAVLLLPELASVQRDALSALAFCLRQNATQISFARKAAEKLAQAQQFSSTGWNWTFQIQQEAAAQRKSHTRDVSVRLPMAVRCKFVSPDVFFGSNLDLPREALQLMSAFVDKCATKEAEKIRKNQQQHLHQRNEHDDEDDFMLGWKRWEEDQDLSFDDAHFLLRLAAAATLLQGVELTQFFTGEYDLLGPVSRRVATEEAWASPILADKKKDSFLASPSSHAVSPQHHHHHHPAANYGGAGVSSGLSSLRALHSPRRSDLNVVGGMGSTTTRLHDAKLATSDNSNNNDNDVEVKKRKRRKRSIDQHSQPKQQHGGHDGNSDNSNTGDDSIEDEQEEEEEEQPSEEATTYDVDPVMARILRLPRFRLVRRAIASVFKSARKKNQLLQSPGRMSSLTAQRFGTGGGSDDYVVTSPDAKCPFAMGPSEGPLLHRVHWLVELADAHPRGYLAVSAATSSEALGRFLLLAALTWNPAQGTMLCPEPLQRLRLTAAQGVIRNWWLSRLSAVRAERSMLMMSSSGGGFQSMMSASGGGAASGGSAMAKIKRAMQSGVFATKAVATLIGGRTVSAAPEESRPGSRLFRRSSSSSATPHPVPPHLSPLVPPAVPSAAAAAAATSARPNSAKTRTSVSPPPVPVLRPDSALPSFPPVVPTSATSAAAAATSRIIETAAIAAASANPTRGRSYELLSEIEKFSAETAAKSRANNDFVCMRRAKVRVCTAPLVKSEFASKSARRRPTAVLSALQAKQEVEAAAAVAQDKKRKEQPGVSAVSSRVWAQRSTRVGTQRTTKAEVERQKVMTAALLNELLQKRGTGGDNSTAAAPASTLPSSTADDEKNASSKSNNNNKDAAAVTSSSAATPVVASTRSAEPPPLDLEESALLPPLPQIRDDDDEYQQYQQQNQQQHRMPPVLGDEGEDEDSSDDDAASAISFHSGDDMALPSNDGAANAADENVTNSDAQTRPAAVAADQENALVAPDQADAETTATSTPGCGQTAAETCEQIHDDEEREEKEEEEDSEVTKQQQQQQPRTLSDLGRATINTALRNVYAQRHGLQAAPSILTARPPSASPFLQRSLRRQHQRPTSAATAARGQTAAAFYGLLPLKTVDFGADGPSLSSSSSSFSTAEKQQEPPLRLVSAIITRATDAVVGIGALPTSSVSRPQSARVASTSSSKNILSGRASVCIAPVPPPLSSSAALQISISNNNKTSAADSAAVLSFSVGGVHPATVTGPLAVPNAAHEFHVACLREQQLARERTDSAREKVYAAHKQMVDARVAEEERGTRQRYQEARAAAGLKRKQPYPLGHGAPLLPFSVSIPAPAAGRPSSSLSRSQTPRGKKQS